MFGQPLGHQQMFQIPIHPGMGKGRRGGGGNVCHGTVAGASCHDSRPASTAAATRRTAGTCCGGLTRGFRLLYTPFPFAATRRRHPPKGASHGPAGTRRGGAHPGRMPAYVRTRELCGEPDMPEDRGTYFLPAERLDQEQIGAMAQDVAASPAAASLKLVPLCVIIVNDTRQIVYANERFVSLIGAASFEGVMRLISAVSGVQFPPSLPNFEICPRISDC